MQADITCSRLTILTLSAVFIQIVGLSVFVFGFFPVKPALSGVSGPESFYAPGCENGSQMYTDLPPDRLKSLYQELSGIPPLFNRVILMVIDGLPAEFVLGKDGQPPRKDLMDAMPYTQLLLSNGRAIGYHAKAAPPTVTMPRLKAMVSGAIGGFLDVALNFNTHALLDDNLLGQLFRIGWKMVMLGDETWLKLFPELFMRHDGVSSFFVKDTVQVDHNVSRHLPNELNSDDWDLLLADVNAFLVATSLDWLALVKLNTLEHLLLGFMSVSIVCAIFFYYGLIFRAAFLDSSLSGLGSCGTYWRAKQMDEVVKLIHLSSIKSKDTDYGQTLLVVVSDHGMTENGNHGGSSYEETDSLALFIGLETHISSYPSATFNMVNQVDIAPTLALLFGVPIPKNNVGVAISETLDSFTDDRKLRALELNSWQLLRLMQARFPGLSCGELSCDVFNVNPRYNIGECSGSVEKMFCCLYLNAANLHISWKSKNTSRSYSGDEYSKAVAAYEEFLKTASEWLSRRVTDKPVSLLAFGVLAMIISCLILLSLLIFLVRGVNTVKKQQLSIQSDMKNWCLDEAYILAVVFMLVVSMASSSMVEEEQYVWHFVLSTLYLLFVRKSSQRSTKMLKGQFEMCAVMFLLLAGRVLRGWHQGGVNWTYLPDISNWLEQFGSDIVRSVQLVSALMVIILGLSALAVSGREIIQTVGFSFLLSGLLVLWHIMEYQDSTYASPSYGSTMLVQIIYAVLSFAAIGTVVVLPWLRPIKDSSFVIGVAYVFSWCLLQFVLQQPINSVPLLLFFMQILAGMLYYSCSTCDEWVEVASLYFTGMAGHFALGNTNTLATIDVAGAFIGLSGHSMVFSGILMFIITYASPMVVLLSMVMYISVKRRNYVVVTAQDIDSGHLLKRALGFPCLIPLGLNSILLTAYTVVLLLMRNHLFVWSVFSPKYLYVCATTVCIYVGVFMVASTETYTHLVLILRRKTQVSSCNGIR